MTRALFPLLFLISLGAQANAEPAACRSQANTVEMVECANWHYQRADRWLNQTYREVREPLDDKARKLLTQAQHTWIKFRDANCKKARDMARGGTMASVLEISCQTDMTERRTRELLGEKEELTGPDGGIAYRRPGATLLGSFACDGRLTEAALGILPVKPPAKTGMRARLTIGAHRLEWPIGGNAQNAVCGADLALSMSGADDVCPAIRIDDGLCDAFIVKWDKARKKFVWQRN